MKKFFAFELFNIGSFSLSVGELIATAVLILLWFGLVILGKKLFRKKNLRLRIGYKHVRASKRFYYIFISYVILYYILKIIGLPTEKVLSFTLFKTKEVDVLAYHIVVLYFILNGTRLIIALLEMLMLKYEHRNDVEKGKSRSIFLIVKYLIYVLAISIFIQSVGFSITFIIASVSALLVGVGLGIQHFFNDVISGIVILFDHSIKAGDIVELQDGLIGEVVETKLRTSKLVTRDDVIMIVPNASFTSDKVINWSHNSTSSRFEVKIGVAYGSDVRLVEKILKQVAVDHPDVKATPEPIVFFKDFGSSSLDFSVKFFSDKQFFIEKICSDIRFEIDAKFREQNISIPFPQQDVYIKSVPN